MTMPTKSVSSTFAILFILLLVIFDIYAQVPDIEARDSECLKEYGGNVGFAFCKALVYPSLCYQKCQKDKGAKGAKCISAKRAIDFKCLCDFCHDEPFIISI